MAVAVVDEFIGTQQRAQFRRELQAVDDGKIACGVHTVGSAVGRWVRKR